MKKLIIPLITIISVVQLSKAQNTFPPSGNVGIGTTSPVALLSVGSSSQFQVNSNGATSISTPAGSAQANLFFVQNSTNGGYTAVSASGSSSVVPSWINGSQIIEFVPYSTGNGIVSSYTGSLKFQTNYRSDRMLIDANGNVGIGTTNPQNKFVVSNGVAGIEINPNATISSATGAYFASYNRSTSAYADIIFDQGGAYTVLKAGGNVGIGTTDTKGYMLAVNGGAIATSMTVKLQTAWPDYVFKKDHPLPSLTEIKSFIEQNQHLPEMPTETEVAKNGINLGEMNKLLTKKIEELTLYLIEKDNTEKQQQEKIASQEKRISKLEQSLEQLLKGK